MAVVTRNGNNTLSNNDYYLSLDNSVKYELTSNNNVDIIGDSINLNKQALEEKIEELIEEKVNPSISVFHLKRLKTSIKLKLVDIKENQFIPELNGHFIKIENDRIYIQLKR